MALSATVQVEVQTGGVVGSRARLTRQPAEAGNIGGAILIGYAPEQWTDDREGCACAHADSFQGVPGTTCCACPLAYLAFMS